MDFDKLWHASEIEFYTDASKNFSLGFGGYCQKSWMQGFWDVEVAKFNPSIQYLELYALTAGFLAWGHRFANKSSPACMQCMKLIRIITLHSMKQNVLIYAKHVISSKNEITDALSRGQTLHFKKLTRNLNFDLTQTPIPEQIWPVAKVWKM